MNRHNISKKKIKEDFSKRTPSKTNGKATSASSARAVVQLKDILKKPQESSRTERLKRRLDICLEGKVDSKKSKLESNSRKSPRKLSNGDCQRDESDEEEKVTPKKNSRISETDSTSRWSLRTRSEENSNKQGNRITDKNASPKDDTKTKRITRSTERPDLNSKKKGTDSNALRKAEPSKAVGKKNRKPGQNKVLDNEEESLSSDSDISEVNYHQNNRKEEPNTKGNRRKSSSLKKFQDKTLNGSSSKKDNSDTEITEIIDDSESEEISSDETGAEEVLLDSDVILDETDESVPEISDEEEIGFYQSSLVSQASLQLKVKKLEDMLQRVQEQYDKKLKKKDESITRLQNEVKWKGEQMEEMNDLMTKNMEMEAKIKFMLSDRECYEKEIENIKTEEEAKIKKEKEEKDLAEKKKIEEENKKKQEKEKSKATPKRCSKRKKKDESDGEDIDALFVSDTEDNDIEVIGEKKSSPITVEDSIDESKASDQKDKESAVQENSQKSEDKDDVDKQGRHNIRKLMGSKKLKEETVQAAKTEKERRERAKKEHDKHLVVTEKDHKTKFLVCSKLVLAFKEGSKDPLVEVNPKLIKKLKPHQWEAVEFMWDNVIESVDRLNDDEIGQGCILAHCMGLGKTLSVITLVHTLLKSKTIGFKRCLVVCPLNTVLNWQYEWKKWLDKKDRIHTYEMASCKHNHDRAKLLSEWHNKGGIMIIGYQLFRILANYPGRSKKNKKIFDDTLIDPGADIVVCDEGHMLKNDASAVSKAMNRIKTKRRIVLTGTPLQNNLVEYHCMVSFVKPSLLGTAREFKNRFVNPISNGQHSDSTIYDVKLMKRRAHILHEMLEGCVQRKDYSALTKLLPPKHEYVISIRLSELQVELYEKYLQFHRPDDGSAPSVSASNSAASLFSDYQALMRIWTHPWVMKLDEIRQDKKALLMQDDELDTFDEEDEEILISSDTEEETTTTVSSSNESSDDEKSGQESDISETESDSQTKRKSKTESRKKRGNLRSIKQDKGSKDTTDSDQRDGPKEVTKKRQTRNTSDLKSDSDAKSKDKSENKNKKDNKNQRNNDKKKNVSNRDIKSGDVEMVEDSNATTSKSTSERKAKVLAGEVIRKWGSMSRHGGTEALNFDDLKKKEDPWWYKLVNEEEHKKKLEIGGKLVLLFEILRLAETLGDKVLVFSQSLLSLDLIESFLSYKTEEAEKEAENTKSKKGPKPSFWKKDEDYLRMDGSTGAHNRSRLMSNFNELKNKRLRLFLISTKAGGLGVNLDAANRVIIFDASWNPSHDVQSIFRVYRFGQVKSVYIYRFLAQGTMEEKIYERQVAKETLSQRVIDEHQIDRHFTAADLQELYIFKPDKLNDPDKPKRPIPAVPKDVLLAELLTEQRDWIVGYHEHDSLLENRPEEDLSEEERAAAWEEYEREKKGLYMYSGPPPPPAPSHQQHHFPNVPYPSANSLIQTLPPINVLQRPTPRVQFYGATVVPLNSQGIKPMGPIKPMTMPTEVRPNFQMSQLPRVVQEIVKYNPNIGPEDLQKRLQAFLGMQNRYASAPGQAMNTAGRPPGFSKQSSEEEVEEVQLPSRLPQPGIVPANNK